MTCRLRADCAMEPPAKEAKTEEDAESNNADEAKIEEAGESNHAVEMWR